MYDTKIGHFSAGVKPDKTVMGNTFLLVKFFYCCAVILGQDETSETQQQY